MNKQKCFICNEEDITRCCSSYIINDDEHDRRRNVVAIMKDDNKKYYLTYHRCYQNAYDIDLANDKYEIQYCPSCGRKLGNE